MANNIFNNNKTLSVAILVEIICLIVVVVFSAYCLRMLHLGEVTFKLATQLRYNSYLLADELRQSSDDLTRMIRTYVVTGDSKFEEYFSDILDIRNGKKPRPVHYERVYWDFMTVKNPVAPYQNGEPVSLEKMMVAAGFTEKEFQLLGKAKRESDKLVAIEQIAMNAVKGELDGDKNLSSRGEPDLELARQIVFGNEYHETKVKIMRPINEFLKSLDQRTLKNVNLADSQVQFYKNSLIWSLFVLILNGVLLLVTTNRHQKLMVNGLENAINQLSSELTERKKVEKELRSSETKYRELVEQSPIGLALCKLDGQLVSVNPAYAKIIGYSIEEVLKLTYWEITPKKYFTEEEHQLEQLRNVGYYGPYEKEYLHKDGSLVPVRLNGMVVIRDDEKHIWSSVEDITALKKAEKETFDLLDRLRQSHKMEAIGTLAGGIAHDFNNILAAILGYSDLALDDIPHSSPARNQIEQVLKASYRAKDLVKHILSFSRMEPRERSSVQINILLEEALKLLRATIPTTIEIKKNIEFQDGNILADPTQIHQVLMNLCTNAAQAMDEEGGILEVGLNSVQLDGDGLAHVPNFKPGHYLCLSIRDNGAGIEQDHLERIFDPYFTTKEVGKGSGMGLAVVKGIVNSHEGVITVDSKPGEGAVFSVYFPIIEKQPRKVRKEIKQLPTGKEHILIVDDEEAVADMTKRRVERLGYTVTTKTSSKEALELFRSQPNLFDVVITDHTMPELTGDKLAMKLMQIRKDIPIIICTGYSSQIDAEKADFIGVSAFLMKPVDKRELAEAIRNVLEMK